MNDLKLYDVFISYSTHNRKIAVAICDELESHGISCWIAPRNITPGAEWAASIIDAINASRIFVIVISSSSNSSSQVFRETEQASNKGIPIVPVIIDRISISKSLDFFISSYHWLEAQTLPFNNHLPMIVETVQRLLAGEDAVPTVTRKAKRKKGKLGRLRSCIITGLIIVASLAVVVGIPVYFLNNFLNLFSSKQESSLSPSTSPGSNITTTFPMSTDTGINADNNSNTQ